MSHDKEHSHHSEHDHSSHNGDHGKKHTCCGRHKHGDEHHTHDHHNGNEDGCGCRSGEGHSASTAIKAKLVDMTRHHQDYTNDLLLLIRTADHIGSAAAVADLKSALEHSMGVDSCLQAAVDKLV